MKLLLLAFGKPILAAAGLSLGTYSARVQHLEAELELEARAGAGFGEVERGGLQLEKVLPDGVEVEIVPAERIDPAPEEEPDTEEQP